MMPRNALTTRFEHYQYHFKTRDFQNSLFASPGYRVIFALDPDTGPWNFNVRTTYTNSQNLDKFYNYDGNQRYNLDGTPT